MMERIDKLAAIAADILPHRFVAGYQDAIRHTTANQAQIIENLVAVLDEAIAKVSKYQKTDAKGALEYISFSVLQSNLLSGKHSLLVEMFDGNYYLDEAEVSVEWPLNWLFIHADEEFEATVGAIRGAIPRVQDYELHELKNMYYLNYYGVAIQVLCFLLPKVFSFLETTLSSIECGTEIKVSCGQYMGQQLCIYTRKAEK